MSGTTRNPRPAGRGGSQAKRQQTTQPVFGQINEQQGTMVPAPGLAACDTERPAGGQLSRHPGGDAATAARGR
jgi:hypothetical protein